MTVPVTFAEVALPLDAYGYRPHPGHQETKVPAMRRWNLLNKEAWLPDALAHAIEKYPDEDYCCCLAVQSELVAIDLDIVEPVHAEYADQLADDILGRTPLKRIGLHPKQLRLYRNDHGIRSRKVHPLEVFSGSGQFVAYGWHQKAGRPYYWSDASPLEIPADSCRIPVVTQGQLTLFTERLFQVVPRRLLTARSNNAGASSTVGERLRMLTTLHGSWTRAAAIVLSEAAEGIRNETAWAVITSAVGRGIPEETVWALFDRHFAGWKQAAGDGGVTPEQLCSMIERTRRPAGAMPSNVSSFRCGGR